MLIDLQNFKIPGQKEFFGFLFFFIFSPLSSQILAFPVLDMETNQPGLRGYMKCTYVCEYNDIYNLLQEHLKPPYGPQIEEQDWDFK